MIKLKKPLSCMG